LQALRLENRSGKIIALGRLTLAMFFLLALMAGGDRQMVYPTWTYGLTGFYVAAAALLLLATWSDWWVDHKLRLPSHLLDLAVFAGLLMSSGATVASPFFPFFVFLVLSAAVRWGWQAAMLTAAFVALVFAAGTWTAMSAGALAADETSWVILRGGHLLVLSVIIAWFGVTHYASRGPSEVDLPQVIAAEPPAGRAAKYFAECLGTDAASLVWIRPGESRLHLTRWNRDGGVTEDRLDAHEVPWLVAGHLSGKSFLADLARCRVLVREQDDIRAIRSDPILHPELAPLLPFSAGLATPLNAKSYGGYFFAGQVPGLCADDLPFAERISEQVGLAFDRSASLDSATEAAGSRIRLEVARDLHDSVAQILAGLAMRLRAARTSADAQVREAELAEIEADLAGYQQYIYGVIESLRGTVPLPQPTDLRLKISELAEQLKRHWGVAVSAEGRPLVMLDRALALDVELILREAVSNAVRHGQARRIRLSAAADGGNIVLRCKDDGGGFEMSGSFDDAALRAHGLGPASILERVGQLGGQVGLDSSRKGATVTVTLPLEGAGA
jgi:signal transduction histidine kinase